MKLVRRVAPDLWSQHPNFFLVYFATAVGLHLGIGLTQLIDQERFKVSTFERLYSVLPIEIWGFVSIGVWVLMTIGAYHNFARYGRLGLSVGLFVCIARGLLMEFSSASSGGLFVWCTLAVFHYAQLAEPQSNPLTEKR